MSFYDWKKWELEEGDFASVKCLGSVYELQYIQMVPETHSGHMDMVSRTLERRGAQRQVKRIVAIMKHLEKIGT